MFFGIACLFYHYGPRFLFFIFLNCSIIVAVVTEVNTEAIDKYRIGAI